MSVHRYLRRALLLVCVIAAAAPALTLAKTRVNLGTVVWVGYGPLYVADALDLFGKYDLDVELVNFTDNAAMPPALYSGSIDAATLTYDQVIGAVAKGWPLKVVMPLDYSAGGDAIVASTSVQSIKDLKGKKVAYAPLSPSDFLLGYALAANGLTDADVEHVHTTAEGVPGALVSNAVQVGVTYEPNVSAIVNAGGGGKYHVILSTRDAKGIITDVLAVKADTIAAKPDMIEGLMRSYLDGLAYMQQEPDKAAAIIAKAMGVSVEDAKAQLGEVYNPPLSELGDVFVKSDAVTSFYVSGEIIADILLRKEQISAKPPIEATYDERFVKKLQSSL